ncbi:hypothetical protein COOONC_27397, partial [Cooperia oncophora]
LRNIEVIRVDSTLKLTLLGDTAAVQEAQQPAAAAVQEAQQPAAEASEVENHEAAYDLNAYPGYIWNYETQQWDVDPNYDPSQHQSSEYAYQYDGYSTTVQGDGYTYPEGGYDQTYGQTYAYDQNDTYTSSAYPSDPSAYVQGASGYSGYDQHYAYDQAGSHAGYDQAGSHTGYDTTATTYDQQYPDVQGNGYADGSYYHAGYNQNPVEYSEPPIGDQSNNDYDTSATTTDVSTGYGYDQPGYDQPGYDNANLAAAGAAAYDYSSTSYGSSSAAASAAGYGYGQVEYGNTATTAESQAPVDYSSYSHEYSTDYSNYQYPKEQPAQDYSGSSHPPEAGTSHPYPTQPFYQSVSEKSHSTVPFSQPLFQR